MKLFAALLIGSVCGIGCKSAPELRESEHLLDANAESHSASGNESALEPAVSSTPPSGTASEQSRPPNVIYQSEIWSVLDTSPGVFLSHIDAEPRLRGGRFAGWFIRRFFPEDARFLDAPLRPGDIVLRVNSSTLERPEQLSALWKRMRDATQLEVEINRAGVVTTWRWSIVADPSTR